MIQTQKKYSDYLQEVKNILKDTNVEISKINFYEEKINNTELIVPVVLVLIFQYTVFSNSNYCPINSR